MSDNLKGYDEDTLRENKKETKEERDKERARESARLFSKCNENKGGEVTGDWFKDTRFLGLLEFL